MSAPVGFPASAYPASAPPPPKEEIEGVEEKEIESYDMSWDVLGSSIISDLWKLQSTTARELAESLSDADLTILSTFSNMSLEEVKRKFGGIELDQATFAKFDQVLEQLYSRSLENSRFSLTASIIDVEIPIYIQRTSHQALRDRIGRGRRLLEQNPQGASAIEKKKREISKWLLEANETLILYSYKDNEYAIPLRLLFRDGEYPNAKKHFSRLLQQLSTSEHERTQLITLRRELRQKSEAPRSKTEVKEKTESAERKAFRYYQERLMWEAGEIVLKDAFHKSLHPPKGDKLPRELATAIRNASHMNEAWERYSISYLKQHALISDHNYFIAAVWTEFTRLDPKEFMQSYIDSLPEEWFIALNGEIIGSKNPKELLAKAFLRDFRKNPSFESLKSWIEKNKLSQDVMESG